MSANRSARAEINNAPTPGIAWLPPIWLCWLALALVMALPTWSTIAAGLLPEADDYMRLLQVRDWLDGQAWYDTRQYRLNPPHGAAMHWVRLVDLPIAACQILFRMFLSPDVAEHAAVVAVPLLQMLLVMHLLAAVVRLLGGSRPVQLLAALLVAAFPLVLSNLAPGRIDHHGWQAIAALAMAWAMLKDNWRYALLSGLFGSALLMISLEGMAPAAIFGGLFALRYWLWGQRQHEAYLLGLGLGVTTLFAIFRPFGEFREAMCDLPSWPHVLAFGGGAAIAALSRFFPFQDRAAGRLLSLMPIAAIAAAALFVPLGLCVISPLDLNPYMHRFWFDNMAESAALPQQAVSTGMMTLWTILLALAGTHRAFVQAQGNTERRGWLLLGAAALGAGAYSLMLMRAGLTAQLLTIPLAAVLLGHWLPRARSVTSALPRILATVLAIGLCTPLAATTATRPFNRPVMMSVLQPPSGLDLGDCPIEQLRTIPKAVFYTPLDKAPELLARTRHSAVMSGYHRNIAKMEQVVRSFEQPVDQSKSAIMASGADYLAICASSSDLWLAASSGQDSLASRFVSNRTMPEWLEPVPGFESFPMKVYKVRR